MPKKKIEINLNEIVSRNIQLTVKRYMYVARLAFLAQRCSMQKIISGFFPPHWEEESEKLAAMTRKLGHKDSEFYPPQLLRRMGIKVRAGRRWRSKGD